MAAAALVALLAGPTEAGGEPREPLRGVAFVLPWSSLFTLQAEIGVRGRGLRGFTAQLSLIYWLPADEGRQPFQAVGLGLREFGFPITWAAGSVDARPPAGVQWAPRPAPAPPRRSRICADTRTPRASR